MSTNLINLSKLLYELKQKNILIEANNVELKNKIDENEENIIFTMMACVELYETLLTISFDYEYGKDTVVKMASAMVNVYVNLIKRGLKTIEEVPEKLRAEVEEELGKGE